MLNNNKLNKKSLKKKLKFIFMIYINFEKM